MLYSVVDDNLSPCYCIQPDRTEIIYPSPPEPIYMFRLGTRNLTEVERIDILINPTFRVYG